MTGGDPTPDATVLIDGRPVPALRGRTLAAVLRAAGVTATRRNPVTGEPRGAYCGMGVCFECEVRVDGVPGVRACLTHVRDEMRVETVRADDAG